MRKRILFNGVSVAILLALPLVGGAANIPVKVFENGANNSPIPVSGAKIEVLGGYGFKSLLSSGMTYDDGESRSQKYSACR